MTAPLAGVDAPRAVAVRVPAIAVAIPVAGIVAPVAPLGRLPLAGAALLGGDALVLAGAAGQFETAPPLPFLAGFAASGFGALIVVVVPPRLVAVPLVVVLAAGLGAVPVVVVLAAGLVPVPVVVVLPAGLPARRLFVISPLRIRPAIPPLSVRIVVTSLAALGALFGALAIRLTGAPLLLLPGALALALQLVVGWPLRALAARLRDGPARPEFE